MKQTPKVSKAKPKSCAQAADELYQVREERLQIQKVVETFEAREQELKNYLIDNLPKSKAEGITGKVATAQVVTKPKPIVKEEDWSKFYAHIKKTGSFELLQRRINESAVKERWENNKEVPGVSVFNAITVSITKKSKK